MVARRELSCVLAENALVTRVTLSSRRSLLTSKITCALLKKRYTLHTALCPRNTEPSQRFADMYLVNKCLQTIVRALCGIDATEYLRRFQSVVYSLVCVGRSGCTDLWSRDAADEVQDPGRGD